MHRTFLAWSAGLALVTATALCDTPNDPVDGYVTEMIRIEATWKEKVPRSKERAELDEIVEKRFPERIYRSFAGVFNHVNFKKLGDKSWDVPGLPRDTKQTYDQRGPQIRGAWSSGKDGAPSDQVTCVVVSFAHGTPVAFTSPERKVEPDDVKALLTAFHEDGMARLSPVPEPTEGEDPSKPDDARKSALADRKKCAEPKKSRIGDICDWSASTQGTVSGTGTRERREWYAWSSKDRKATFVLFVRFHESALSDSTAIGKGASFAKAISDGK
jgi:hypothetical protein